MKTVEVKTGLSDVWFARLFNMNTSSKDLYAFQSSKIYPNPTSNYLYFENIDFDHVIIKSIDGVCFLDINNYTQGVDLSSLPVNTYIASFYKDGQLVLHEKIFQSQVMYC